MRHQNDPAWQTWVGHMVTLDTGMVGRVSSAATSHRCEVLSVMNQRGTLIHTTSRHVVACEKLGIRLEPRPDPVLMRRRVRTLHLPPGH
ncbi:hypothetical protein [Streptomyces actinomycinicus]